MSESKLPADPLVLVLGIISLVLGIGGCCFTYGITSIISLIISIIGIVVSNRSLKAYREKSEGYSDASRSNVSVGRTLNIISVVFNAIVLFIFLIGILFFGVIFYNMLHGADTEEFYDRYPYQIKEKDSIYEDEENDEFEEFEKDTLIIDSTFIKELKEIEIIEN